MRNRPLKLWFARVLRLTGIALVFGWFISLGIAYFWGQNGIPSSTIPFWWVSIVLFGLGCILLGISLVLIGEKLKETSRNETV
jgi:ABC-type multidrug transport system permease subunit